MSKQLHVVGCLHLTGLFPIREYHHQQQYSLANSVGATLNLNPSKNIIHNNKGMYTTWQFSSIAGTYRVFFHRFLNSRRPRSGCKGRHSPLKELAFIVWVATRKTTSESFVTPACLCPKSCYVHWLEVQFIDVYISPMDVYMYTKQEVTGCLAYLYDTIIWKLIQVRYDWSLKY